MKALSKYITIGASGILLVGLFSKYPAPASRVLNIQNYLITVGGIISALVIAYLSAKIFNTKAERDNVQKQIDQLGERLTAYRQLLYFVMKSQQFWIKYDDVAKFKKKYPGLTFENMRTFPINDLSRRFWLEESEISHNTISLYTAMEAIYGFDEPTMPPWAYEKNISFNYSINDLLKYLEPSNQIWYYLEGRFSKHGIGLFNDTGLMPLYNQNFRELLSKADVTLKDKDFHREILADLGTKFYEILIPRMIDLIKENSGIPKSLLKTFYSLMTIMFFGVLLPLILQSISVPEQVDVFLTLSFVILTTLSLINFLFEFYFLLFEELHPNQRNSQT